MEIVNSYHFWELLISLYSTNCLSVFSKLPWLVPSSQHLLEVIAWDVLTPPSYRAILGDVLKMPAPEIHVCAHLGLSELWHVIKTSPGRWSIKTGKRPWQFFWIPTLSEEIFYSVICKCWRRQQNLSSKLIGGGNKQFLNREWSPVVIRLPW